MSAYYFEGNSIDGFIYLLRIFMKGDHSITSIEIG